MRVLHLTPELPHWPGGTGGATRQFHLLRRLVELGHEVTVVAPVAPGQARAVTGLAEAGIEAVVAERPRPARVRRCGRSRGAPPSIPAALPAARARLAGRGLLDRAEAQGTESARGAPRPKC